MTKQKGPKKAKTLYTVQRIERKKTRHLTPEALARYEAAKPKPKAPAAKA